MRIDFVAPVIEPPIGTMSVPLKDEAVRIIIINSVFPERKYSYVHCTPIIANYFPTSAPCSAAQKPSISRGVSAGFTPSRCPT